MAETLDVDAIIRAYAKPFESRPTYSPAADCLEWYFEDADYYADWVNSTLTLYKAFADGRVIGFSIANVTALVDRATHP